MLADHRPAHLTRVHQALTTLPEADQRRPGVAADWKHGPHRLTYRQTERTFGLATGALAKDIPDGLPAQALVALCDDLLEASIPEEFKDASTSLAVDWTDVETFSRPPSRGTSDCADPEASRGHRSGGGPGQDSEPLPPQDPRQSGLRSAAITPGATRPTAVTGTPQIIQTTARRTQPATRNSHGSQASALNPAPARNTPGAHEMSDPNVKISAGQT